VTKVIQGAMVEMALLLLSVVLKVNVETAFVALRVIEVTLVRTDETDAMELMA